MLFRTEKETETNRKLRRLSVRSMIAELPDFILILISAIVSKSLIVWADLLGSFSDELHSIVVFLITRRIGKTAGDSWRFDVSRLETMASFICDLIMIVGYVTLMIGAFREIPSPSGINREIFFYFAVKAVAIVFDLYFYHNHKKNYEKHPSAINETEKANWRNNLLIDLGITMITVLCFLLNQYEWSRYISPVAAILLSCWFIRGCVRRIRLSAGELISEGVPVRQQDEIVDILLTHRTECVKQIGDIRCYVLDRRLHIIVGVSYLKETTYQRQTQALETWREAIREKYPESVLTVELVD